MLPSVWVLWLNGMYLLKKNDVIAVYRHNNFFSCFAITSWNHTTHKWYSCKPFSSIKLLKMRYHKCCSILSWSCGAGISLPSYSLDINIYFEHKEEARQASCCFRGFCYWDQICKLVCLSEWIHKFLMACWTWNEPSGRWWCENTYSASQLKNEVTEPCGQGKKSWHELWNDIWTWLFKESQIVMLRHIQERP